MHANSNSQIGVAGRRLPALIIGGGAIGLTLFGLIILSSVTQSSLGGSYYLVGKQALWFVAAAIAGMITYFIDLEELRSVTWVLAGALLVSLTIVLVPGIGVSVNGARRWLDLGLINLQVSDFSRIGLVFVLAHYLALNQRRMDSLRRGFLIPGGIIGITSLLILLEPDYGTAFIVAFVGFILLFLGGARLVFLLPTILIGLFLFFAAIAADPVRMRRVVTFFDIEGNRSDATYQVWQAMLAFAAGGLGGVGIGNGRQQRAFLPEAHTDFIFPIVGEELGFVCTSGVVIIFLVLFLTGIRQLRKAPNLFYYILACGALLMISVQALLNFAVVTGCLPTKGLSLPFLSYGGSNLVATFILVGILLNCFRRWSRIPPIKPMHL
ncbi:MAG: putative peptidoglycan glycosyltransferase FtsW [Candidatus Moanabacter tarae]|uniref:Probable peptidoglycan glycosyltransferase FtsW n=1 Tax=Candidatus Moanibacter tarae TaxID=2200854 RepID=A0A2Z4AGI3_9BACT|nr:MAG: putative peptidoglycan glycosyltransferase FtsW [Candidatus Moanabacter tarae]